MPGLRQLQGDLQKHLVGDESAIADAIVDAPPLTIDARLSIYSNAYRVRLIEALDDTYPVLHAVLGDEDFTALGEAFVAAQPSVHRSIRWYGGELAQFLAGRPPYAGQPIFAELALLEWTLAEVFDAADAEPKPRAALSAIDPSAWGELRFTFHPSLRRLHLEWNTAAVWQAMSREEAPPDPKCAEHPVPWLLWRQNLQNYFRSMSGEEAAALDAALRGETFGEICAALSDWLPEEEIPLRAASLLAAWADSGIIVANK
ncbi:MAG: HvfC/BufC N-terminal domain-containing protein [Steroidobacteraceae bacterium]